MNPSLALLLASVVSVSCSLRAAETLRLDWEKNILTVSGERIPGGRVEIWYLEAYCRPGSTDRDWTETVIGHETELVSRNDAGSELRLRCTLRDGVVVEHTLRAAADAVEIRIEAHNPTQRASLAHWAQPCMRVGGFTGANDPDRPYAYVEKSFIFLDGRLARLPTPEWATAARYVPGQVWAAPGVNRDDVNPRPLNPRTPANGLIGCFSADESMILAIAFAPWQELFQGVIRCLHADFRIGGLAPGERKSIRGAMYIVPADVDALLQRYARDFRAPSDTTTRDAGPSAAPPRNDGASWPTLHGDLRRSGFYPSFPRGKLRLAWRKELYRELTGTRAEVIVGGGNAYLGTYAGNVYAWDAASGEERWVFRTGGPVMHSPAFAEDLLVVASMDRTVCALDAAGGTLRWRYEAGGGFWASPAVHRGKVLIGGRDGVFHALDLRSGEPAWTFATGAAILGTASIADDGTRAFFAAEDMHAYALGVNTGALAWRSRKMHGLSVRDYFPVIAGGVAIFTTNPADGFHETLDRHQELFLATAGSELSAQELADRRYLRYDEEGFRREQRAFLAHLERVPSDQTFYALGQADGEEPWVAPIAYTGGLHGPPTPPCYRPGGSEAYVYVRSAYGAWDGGGEVRPYSGVGKLDLASGRVDLVTHGYRATEPDRGPGSKDLPWGSFWTIGDEAQALSLSADDLFSNHQSSIGAMSFATGLCRLLFGKRDTYGGFYGPGIFGWGEEGREKASAAGQPFGIVNEWHGPARSIASVADGRVYFHVGSQVLCLEEER